MAAGDTTWAARLVEQHLSGTLRRGESVTLQRWLSVLPDDTVRSVPALCLAEGLMELHLGQLDAVERLLEHAERAFAVRAEPQELEMPTDGGMVAEVPAAIALLRAELALGSRRARADGLPDRPWRSWPRRNAVRACGPAGCSCLPTG